TFAADRSKGRIIFSYACLSTACLCPLVFGFPTEMWMAHALFWPTLAVCHYASGNKGIALVFAMLLALVFTHGGALIFAVAIVVMLSLRGVLDGAFLRRPVPQRRRRLVSRAIDLRHRDDDIPARPLRRHCPSQGCPARLRRHHPGQPLDPALADHARELRDRVLRRPAARPSEGQHLRCI